MGAARDVILAIEISNPGAEPAPSADPAQGPGVALGRLTGGGVDVLGVEPVRPRRGDAPGVRARGGHDDDLMPAIDRLFRRAAVQRVNLARVAVSAGPGGYTSLRVACAAGKMIAEACGVPCASVPTARAVLETVPDAARAAGVAVALASKGDSAWVEVFNNGGRSSAPGRVLRAADLAPLAAAGLRTLVADNHFPSDMRAAAQGAGLTVLEPVFDARAVLLLGAVLPTIDPADLNPIYPREPDAVTLSRPPR